MACTITSLSDVSYQTLVYGQKHAKPPSAKRDLPLQSSEENMVEYLANFVT